LGGSPGRVWSQVELGLHRKQADGGAQVEATGLRFKVQAYVDC
jgi:hypothetical protein